MIRNLMLTVVSVFALTIFVVDATAAGHNVRGKHTHSIRVDGVQREFIVYVPRMAVDATAPVVFMLHGSSGDGEKFYRISGWREKADEVGLIAVFPSALTYCFHEDENADGDFDDRGEGKITTKWAAGALGTPEMPLCTANELAVLPARQRALADHPLMDDIAFFRAMLEELSQRYSVNDRRIYASGFSNGASMTSRMALEMPGLFAAIGAAAGSLELPPVPALPPVPFLASVGELDNRATTALGIPAIPLVPTLFQDVPALYNVEVAPMLTVLQLEGTYQYNETDIAGAKVSGFLFRDSLVGESNVYGFLVIQGLAHQYPNGTNHPMVMANVLWEFFRMWSLPA